MNSEIVKTVANISIEGMTCSSGCGGKIQQELQTLKGVKSTNLDFAENRIENIISVEYSPNLTSEKEMLNCIAAIADGKYKVAAVAIIQYKGLQGTGGGSTNNPEISSNELGNVFQLFNLLQTLSKIVE